MKRLRAALGAVFAVLMMISMSALPAYAAGSNTLTVVKTRGEGITPGAPLGGASLSELTKSSASI